MTGPIETIGPRDEADRVFEAGLAPGEVTASLARLDDAGKAEFLRRLGVRASLHEDNGAAPDDGDDASLLAAFERAYEADMARTPEVESRKDLSDAGPWLAAQGAFNDDIDFVMKLYGRHVTRPTVRFMRYLADALGVALPEVRRHFADARPPGIAGAEHRSSGKPDEGGVEDFAVAVREADVPDELRARWLAE